MTSDSSFLCIYACVWVCFAVIVLLFHLLATTSISCAFRWYRFQVFVFCMYFLFLLCFSFLTILLFIFFSSISYFFFFFPHSCSLVFILFAFTLRAKILSIISAWRQLCLQLQGCFFHCPNSFIYRLYIWTHVNVCTFSFHIFPYFCFHYSSSLSLTFSFVSLVFNCLLLA